MTQTEFKTELSQIQVMTNSQILESYRLSTLEEDKEKREQLLKLSENLQSIADKVESIKKELV